MLPGTAPRSDLLCQSHSAFGLPLVVDDIPLVRRTASSIEARRCCGGEAPSHTWSGNREMLRPPEMIPAKAMVAGLLHFAAKTEGPTASVAFSTRILASVLCRGP